MIRVGIHTGENNSLQYRKLIEKVSGLQFIGEYRNYVSRGSVAKNLLKKFKEKE